MTESTVEETAGPRQLRKRLQAAEARVAELQTEVDRLSDAVQQAGRVKDDFLATLSHELRTPLNAMLGWIQLLRLHLDDSAERGHALDVLERNARAQVQIVSDLLDVSRVITGKMRLMFERVDFPDIVRSGCQTLIPTANAKGIELDVQTRPVPGVIFGDPARLQQVVWNLVSNGLKFTPPGGVVRVLLRHTDNAAELEVSDTGVGIDPPFLPYVFERFRQGDSSLTRPFGGLGLGLAIVRHLVELHGGSVTAHSDGPGRGASFTVRLPFHTDSQTERYSGQSEDTLVRGA